MCTASTHSLSACSTFFLLAEIHAVAQSLTPISYPNLQYLHDFTAQRNAFDKDVVHLLI